MMAAKYPILLVHGICPFDRLYVGLVKKLKLSDNLLYFKGIRSHLASHGYIVFVPQLPWASSIKKRAKVLYEYILDKTRRFTLYPKVHIIAHSMGGLDTRAMLFAYDLYDKVASVTTIGTPHMGSVVAESISSRRKNLIRLAKLLGIDTGGVIELTRGYLKDFNRALENLEEKAKTVFRTVACYQEYDRIFLPLRGPWKEIFLWEGENDGLVSFTSSTWKTRYLFKVWELDHLNQIGWWDPSEPLPRRAFEEMVRGYYLELVKTLE